MQIFYVSDAWIIIISVALWVFFQLFATFISRKLPKKWFSVDSFLFKERKWERNGLIYIKIFKVKRWKKYLPDGAAVTKNGYRKKRLRDFSVENLELFIEETCRGELAHLLAILPFWVFGLFAPIEIIGFMFIYALMINLPCIIAQRYNRPRVVRYLETKRNH